MNLVDINCIREKRSYEREENSETVPKSIPKASYISSAIGKLIRTSTTTEKYESPNNQKNFYIFISHIVLIKDYGVI